MTDALNIPQQPTPSSLRCRHISPEASRCGSPAMRGESFCYHHHQTRRPVENLRHRRARQSTFPLPVPNSRADIQEALGTVMVRIAGNDIDLRRAGLLLYALQIASSNLTHHQNQNAQPKPATPTHAATPGNSGHTTQMEQKPEQSNSALEQRPAPEQSHSAPEQSPALEQKCHPERSVAESKDLRLTPQIESASIDHVHYGSGPTPDLAHPQSEPIEQHTHDFTPPPPVWRAISKATGAALLEDLARSEGMEPETASPEDRILSARNGTELQPEHPQNLDGFDMLPPIEAKANAQENRMANGIA